MHEEECIMAIKCRGRQAEGLSPEPEELSDDRRRRGPRAEDFCRNGKNPKPEGRGAGGEDRSSEGESENPRRRPAEGH